MSTKVQLYEAIDITNTKDSFSFPDTHTGDYAYSEGQIDYTFLSIEIRSEFPPTDCILKLSHTHQNSNAYKTFTIHFMKYRQKFIYENGFYILYFTEDVLVEIPKDIVPMKCSIENKRDENTTAKLFYRTSFNSRK
jgi:hypothetical protein